MTEAELYKDLSILTKNKEQWKENISYVGDLLHGHTVKITAKALWMLGEMGLVYPREAAEIFRVLGKRRPEFVQPYLEKLMCLSENDPNRVVRIHSAGAIKAARMPIDNTLMKAIMPDLRSVPTC